MPKPVVLSPHALQMMAERAIKVEWIEQVIATPGSVFPDPTYPARRRAFGRVEEMGGKWLRVVYIETTEAVRVITVFFDRGREKLR